MDMMVDTNDVGVVVSIARNMQLRYENEMQALREEIYKLYAENERLKDFITTLNAGELCQ